MKEQTGHKCDAVILYRKSLIFSHVECTALKMEEIRSSQDRMLAEEEALENKKSSRAPSPQEETNVKKSN